jgi:hypothetical protein
MRSGEEIEELVRMRLLGAEDRDEEQWQRDMFCLIRGEHMGNARQN